MKPYSVTYKDRDGNEHTVAVEGTSGTHALAVAMEEVDYLKVNPSSITRVFKEER